MREVLSTVTMDNNVYVFMSDGSVYLMITVYSADFTEHTVKFTLVGRIPDANQTNN